MDLIGNTLHQLLPQCAEISCAEILTRRRQYLQVLVGTFGLLRCELPDASFHARVTEVGLSHGAGLMWRLAHLRSLVEAKKPWDLCSSARVFCPNIPYEKCTSTTREICSFQRPRRTGRITCQLVWRTSPTVAGNRGQRLFSSVVLWCSRHTQYLEYCLSHELQCKASKIIPVYTCISILYIVLTTSTGTWSSVQFFHGREYNREIALTATSTCWLQRRKHQSERQVTVATFWMSFPNHRCHSDILWATASMIHTASHAFLVHFSHSKMFYSPVRYRAVYCTVPPYVRTISRNTAPTLRHRYEYA